MGNILSLPYLLTEGEYEDPKNIDFPVLGNPGFLGRVSLRLEKNASRNSFRKKLR